MHAGIVHYLRCPLTGAPLNLHTVEESVHPVTGIKEINLGWLETSFPGPCYPIEGGVPRLLPEAMLQYRNLLHSICPSLQDRLQFARQHFGEQMEASAGKNARIQQTFGFEWNLLKKDPHLKIWNLDQEAFRRQLIKELALPDDWNGAMVLDAGCGHGRSARLLAEKASVVFGAEVSQAVELAYMQNDKPNCHFVQADIHHLPFAASAFDLVYSSGVLHHNPNTRHALLAVHPLVSPGGAIVVWLYHPRGGWLHASMKALRSVTKRLPVQWVYAFNSFTLCPVYWVISQWAGQKKRFTEISIELLDMLTPAYRHEHSHEEVMVWLQECGYALTEITDADPFGFAIKGEGKKVL